MAQTPILSFRSIIFNFSSYMWCAVFSWCELTLYWSDDRTMCYCLVSLPCTGGRNKLALVCFCFCSLDHGLRLHPAQSLVLPQQLQPARPARRLRGAHLHLPLVSDVTAATGAAAASLEQLHAHAHQFTLSLSMSHLLQFET